MKGAILLPLAAVSLATAPAEDLLEGLKPSHPRLLVANESWAEWRHRADTEPVVGKITRRAMAEADWFMEQRPLEYRKTGRRLLSVSREALDRVILWSMARHLKGEARYAQRAEQEMLQLCSFPDWNPSHFLDTAEMTTALALGYDWLFDDLQPESRETIREAIVRMGIEPGLERNWWWMRRDNNWNQVCFGGLTLGALAIADESPEPARKLLEAAREGIHHGLGTYAPDGLYPEGPGYWNYGTIYQCLMIEALRSSLGTSWGLESSEGYLDSAEAQVLLTGPTGLFYNFSDGGARAGLQPPLFWFARETDNPSLLESQIPFLNSTLESVPSGSRPATWSGFRGLVGLWWSARPEGSESPELPLAWKAEGPNPVAVFRSSWSDPQALYLACKGGRPDLSHGHMDAGSFILEADGVRWAVELGAQSYHSLESKGIRLWDDRQNGQRWSVFRLNNRSHNTLTINDQLHRVEGEGRFTDFGPTGAELDLSAVFKGEAKAAKRSFEVKGRQVTVRDQLKGLKPGSTVRWAMATRAQVEIEGSRAILRQAGKTLEAELGKGSDAEFAVIPADPPADGFNAPNPGVSLLVARAQAPETGEMQLEVVLKPDAL